MRCPNCGNEISSDSRYCAYCGRALVQGIIAPNLPPLQAGHPVAQPGSHGHAAYFQAGQGIGGRSRTMWPFVLALLLAIPAAILLLLFALLLIYPEIGNPEATQADLMEIRVGAALICAGPAIVLMMVAGFLVWYGRQDRSA